MDQLKESSLIVINRCPDSLNRANFRRSLKIQNPGAQLIFEDLNGEIIPHSAEDLPYDVSGDRIVIADDGSTDSSANIIKAYVEKNSNIELYSKTNEKSISKTRNFLLSKITSPLFTFFDSDDYAEPTYVEELYNLMINYNTDMSICGKSRHSEFKEVNLEPFNKKQENP